MAIDVRAQQSAVLHLFIHHIAIGTTPIRRLTRLQSILERLGTPRATVDAACVFGLTIMERRRRGDIADVHQRYDC